MKKLNTFLKFLETHYPHQDEVHHNIKYDVKVYTTADPLVSPLGDPVTLNKYYDKCIRHIVHKEPWRIQEYLFYADQAAQAGQTPLPYDQWDMARKAAGATSVNVGGEGQRMGSIPAGMAAVPDPTNPSQTT